MATLLPLKVLILEDQPSDAELMLDELRQSGFDPDWQRVQTKAEFLAGLSPTLDIILADYRLPQFDGLSALRLVQERGLDIPFILISGSIGEEIAVAAMQQGVADYLLKDRLTRLGQAVTRALADKHLREQQRYAENLLRESEARYRTLVEQASDGIFIANSEGRFVQVNSAGCHLLGYTRDELLQKTISDLTKVDPDQPLRIDEFRQGKTLITNREMIRKDGTLVSVEISSKQLLNGDFQGIVRDTTERKRAETELRKLHTAVEQSGSSVVITDLKGDVEYVNPGFTTVTGYARDEIIGKNPRILKSGVTPPHIYSELWATLTRGDVWRGELHNRKKSGELFWEMATISPVKDQEGRVISYLAVKDDITERKRAEEEISSLARFPAENPQPVLRLRDDGLILYANGKGQALLAELGCVVGDHAPQLWQDLIGSAFVSQSSQTIDFQQGDKVWALVAAPFSDRGYANIYGTDISERRQAENLLASERNLLRTLIDSLPDRIYAKDIEGRFILKNEADVRQMGAVSAYEVIGKTDFHYYPSETAAQYHKDDQEVIQSGQPLLNREEAFEDSDGNSGWMLTSKVPLRDPHGNVVGLVGIEHDITELKLAEASLRILNRTLAVLSSVNHAIVRVRDTSELFEETCRIAVEQGGFQMAWIGLLDPDGRQVIPVAHAGVIGDYLETVRIVSGDEPNGHGPGGGALRTGEPVVVNDIEHDPRMIPWREDALKLGYRAVIALPIKVADEVRGIFSLYSTSPEFFNADEVKLLNESAADLSFAVEVAEHEAERQQAEAALKQHMQAIEEMRLFLQTTLDAFPANTAVLDSYGVIINVNAAWVGFAEDNSGSSPMYYLGKNYLTICGAAAGPNAEEAPSAADGIRAVIGGLQDEFNLEYPCDSPDEKRWFAMRVTPFPEPAPRRVVVAHINITERHEAQDRLQDLYNDLEKRVIIRTAELQATKERVELILSNSADGILLLQPDFTIQQTNASFNDMFDCEQGDYFGQPVTALVDLNARDVLSAILKNPLDQRKVSVDVEARRKNGTLFAAEMSIASIRDDGFVCTVHDISERKRVEQSLRSAVKKEKELNELKSRFVSMASHEFRTPLATIRATVDTLSAYRQRLTDDQISKKLSNIDEQINFLTDVMDDVLELARLQARRREYQPETLDLNKLWQAIIEEFQSHQNISHYFRYLCESVLPPIQADNKLMRQIMTNLLSNAIKYSSPDKVITIVVEPIANDAAFSVQDEGIGIPEDDLQHLFEPFHRAANVGNIQGTGLGLVIAKEAVDLHGGTITVDSQVGVGTKFTVRIPIAAKEERKRS